MSVKLFVLGGPGSGKSTIARSIAPFLNDQQWVCEKINDYPILQAMVEEDYDRPKSERWLRWIDEHDKSKGFDVLNIKAFDQALKRLEIVAKAKVDQHKLTSSQPYLALIEFSRNDYKWALHQFNPEFLQRAYFIYLKTNLDVCKARIHRRALHPRTADDYDVSDYIFQTYYDHDNGVCLEQFLEEYGISKRQLLTFDNSKELANPDGRENVALIEAYVQKILLESGLLSVA